MGTIGIIPVSLMIMCIVCVLSLSWLKGLLSGYTGWAEGWELSGRIWEKV